MLFPFRVIQFYTIPTIFRFRGEMSWSSHTRGFGLDYFLFIRQPCILPSASQYHYNDVIMSAVASQITSVFFFCSTAGSGPDQRKHQSSASLAFLRGIRRWPGHSPHKCPVTRKMFPFDDVIMMGFALLQQTVSWWYQTNENIRFWIPEVILFVNTSINELCEMG